MPRTRPGLDRPTIVAAALETLDERGLDGLSSRDVARRLGVQQPALYHHFRNKAELLSAVAAEVLDRWHTDRLPEPGERWDAFLLRNARSLRRAMLAVRDGARLIASTGPRAPNLANSVAQVAHLEAQGFAGTDAVLAFIAVSRYTIGATLEEQSAPGEAAFVADDGAGPGTGADRGDGRGDAVEDAGIEGAEHLLAVVRAVADLGPAHEFDVGLTALVRGLAPSND
ncbi:TetR family transcriptional regulator [Promicromonospora sukumoe]|uniref:TetR family transcriptional regulator n=1 Tax=Promicromonospora sukumoe TaxID=88382 RepID=UPI0037C95565